MNKFGLVIGLLWASLAMPANAQNNVRIHKIFDGTIGNSPIIFHSTETYDKVGGKNVEAEYFYKKHHKIISLIDLGVDNKTSFQEIDYGCVPDAEENCSPRATLTFDSNDFNKGIFKSLAPDARPIEISLRQIWKGQSAISYSEPNYNENGENEFYKYLADNGVTYSKPKVKGAIAFQTATDNLTKVNYPYLAKFPNKNAMAKANSWLSNMRNQMVRWALECYSMPVGTSPAHGTFGDWDAYTSEISYIATNIMVIEESGSTFCDGAHPNNTYSFSMWDFTKGQEFKISDYFNLYLPKKPDEYEDKKTPAYAKFMKKITPNSKYALYENKTKEEKEMHAECFSEDFSMELSPSFNEKGMVLSLTDVPHVMGACMGDYYQIPYKELVPLMTNAGKKFFAPQLK